MTGALHFTDCTGIYNSGSLGLLSHVSGTGNGWTGVNDLSNAVVVGSSGAQTVIRSTGDDLYHYNNTQGSRYKILDTFNYSSYALPLTGGTIKGTLKIYRDAAAINYCSSGGTSHGWLGFSEADIPRVWLSNGSTSYPLLHTGNYSGYLDGRYYTETEVNNLLSNYLPINGTAAAASKLTSTKVFDFAATAATYCKVASIVVSTRYTGGSGLLKFYTSLTTSTEAKYADSFEVFVHVYQQEALGQRPVLQFKSNNTGDAYDIIGLLNYSSSGSTFDIYAYGKGRSYHGLRVTLVHGDITISPGSYISSLPSGEQIAPQAMGNSKLLNGYASSDFWKKTELTKLSQLTDDVVTGNYLPLAGGNMKNAAVITFTANGTLRQTTATTSNATSIVEWYKGTSKDPNYTHSAQIGWHNTGDTDGAIYLVPYPTSTDPWAGTVGLYIGKNIIKWKNQPLLHSGNYNSYAPTLTGGGASGTWGINISGNAATATSAGSSTVWNRTWSRGNDFNLDLSLYHSQTRVFMVDSTTSNHPTGTSAGFMIAHSWDWGGGGALLYQDFDSDYGRLYTNAKQCDATSYSGWKKVAWTSDIPTVTNYYWANVQISDQSSTSTSPTFANATTTGLLTVSSSNTHKGIKIGNTYINAIDKDVIF